MEEREFFDEKTEKKMATLNCPNCHQPGEYEVTWIVRTKKRQLGGRADERDRARFAKARSRTQRPQTRLHRPGSRRKPPPPPALTCRPVLAHD